MPRATTEKTPSPQLLEAQALLKRLGSLSNLIGALENKLQAEIEHIKASNPRLNELLYERDVLDGRLKQLMKSEPREVFNGLDKVVLPGGILIRGLEQKMSIPRNALNLIKEFGWEEGLKIAESLNRAVIESWPDHRLALIGAKKRDVEKFAYEVTHP